MSTLDPIAELTRAVAAAGSQRAWAARHKVSLGYVNDVLQGRREPGPAILTALGIVREVRYCRLEALAARKPPK